MKITLTKISSLALACLLVAGTGQGQTALLGNLNNDLTPVQSSSQDTIVQVVAEAQGLTLVPPEQVPFCGTFWMVTSGSLGIAVPLPCPPLDPTLPVFQISDGIFLVDGTVGSPVVVPRRAWGGWQWPATPGQRWRRLWPHKPMPSSI
jgi:hypothetical protein